MAFVLQNTLAVTTPAEFHTALVYFWDTLVAGGTRYTVSAHPDASSFKRSYKYTFSENSFNPGNAHNVYAWVNWTSATPSNSGTLFTHYIDDTYTSLPGDLGTHTTHPFTFAYEATGFFGGNTKFWRSDIDSNAFLWTYGTKILAVSFGYDTVFGVTDTQWENGTSGGNNGATFMTPLAYHTYATPTANNPIYGKSSSSETSMPPVVDYYGNSSLATEIYRDYDLNDTSIVTPIYHQYSTNYALRMKGAPSDIACFVPHNATTVTVATGVSSSVQKVFDGTNWWLGQALANQWSINFSFGTTEPDFSV